ncbi:hypothetical protein Tco_1441353, partial [Tanacetum coccineum]
VYGTVDCAVVNGVRVIAITRLRATDKTILPSERIRAIIVFHSVEPFPAIIQ